MSIFNLSDYIETNQDIDLEELDERYLNHNEDTISHLNVKSIQLYDTSSLSFADNSIQTTAFNSDAIENIYLEVQNIIDNNNSSITDNENTFTQKNIFDNDVSINNQLKINDANNGNSFTSISHVGKSLTIDSVDVNGDISFKSNGASIMRLNPENINFYDKQLINVLSMKYKDGTEQKTAFTDAHSTQLNTNKSDIVSLKNATGNLQRLYLPPADFIPEFDMLLITAPNNIILATGSQEDGVEISPDKIKFGNRIITQCPTITDITNAITGITYASNKTSITNELNMTNNDITNVKFLFLKDILGSGERSDIYTNTDDLILKSPNGGTINLINDNGVTEAKFRIGQSNVDFDNRAIINCSTINNLTASVANQPTYAKCRITINSSGVYVFGFKTDNILAVTYQSLGMITLTLDVAANGGPSDTNFVVTCAGGRQHGDANLDADRAIFASVMYKSTVYTQGVLVGYTVQLQLTSNLQNKNDLKWNAGGVGFLDVAILW